MPIAALSENAARAISSTLVLNDAISVIKELIDNALDAHATNIVIEISANTLDIIQVKDNGAGIGIEDRQLLCKRGYTSKIRTLEDLAQLGGTFLGFRGEALASVAELSESAAFTTRVDGETVGTQLRFDSKGKLTGSSSASHGTGTTVRITEFLKSIPVRRQTAQKQASKTLPQIKKLLHEYAFARPTVKFQFKVLKSKSDLKDNWSFAPCKDADSLQLLASKILGKDVATQCKLESIESEGSDYKIDALMVLPDADRSKSGGNHRIFSIDGRPLSAERGITKQLFKIYKSYLQSISKSDTSSLAGSQFLMLRLQCPKGAYDVNIEPAKNEVMFEDAQKVLDLFEILCRQVYGEKNNVQSRHEHVKARLGATTASSFDMLLAKKPAAPKLSEGYETSATRSSEEHEVATGLSASPVRVVRPRPVPRTDEISSAKVYRNMYEVDDDHFSPPTATADLESEAMHEATVEEDVMDPRVTNPFVLAKMNTRVRPQALIPSDVSPRPLDEPHSFHASSGPAPDNQNTANASKGDCSLPDLLPSPSTSPERESHYQNPGPPNRPWRRRQDTDEESPGRSPPSLTQLSTPAKPTLLDAWAQHVNTTSSPCDPAELIEVRRSEPIISSNSSFSNTGNQPLAKHSAKTASSSASSSWQKPFRTPFKKPIGTTSAERGLLSPDMTPGTKPMHALPSLKEGGGPMRRHLPGLNPGQSSSAELEDIMDFEHRKRAAILQHRSRTIERSSEGSRIGRGGSEDGEALLVPSKPYNEGVKEHSKQDSIDYASKFTTLGQNARTAELSSQPSPILHTQNPHLNRYRKAVRDLDGWAASADKANTASTPIELGGDLPQFLPSKLAADDPQAYLITHRLEDKQVDKRGKQRRAKTIKLPFESISVDLATYDSRCLLDEGFNVQRLCRTAKNLSQSDNYVYAGPAFAENIMPGVSDAEMEEYEAMVKDLLAGLSGSDDAE